MRSPKQVALRTLELLCFVGALLITYQRAAIG
jgi:hypothetical protein